jgi:hypothetical protein
VLMTEIFASWEDTWEGWRCDRGGAYIRKNTFFVFISFRFLSIHLSLHEERKVSFLYSLDRKMV